VPNGVHTTQGLCTAPLTAWINCAPPRSLKTGARTLETPAPRTRAPPPLHDAPEQVASSPGNHGLACPDNQPTRQRYLAYPPPPPPATQK